MNRANHHSSVIPCHLPVKKESTVAWLIVVAIQLKYPPQLDGQEPPHHKCGTHSYLTMTEISGRIQGSPLPNVLLLIHIRSMGY